MKNDFVPEVGHGFKLRGDWGGVLDCEVLTLEPNRTLAYSWDFDSEDPAFALQSVVTFTLTPTDGRAPICAWSRPASAPNRNRPRAARSSAGPSSSTTSTSFWRGRADP
jgi:uncharacterized protein YndB with AHSA1/START domain